MKNILKEIHDALTDAINDWTDPDSPEAFVYSMKHLMILRDRIAVMLKLKKP